MGADYYKLLGVDRNANDDDIKRAYKKMVCQLWHGRIFEMSIPDNSPNITFLGPQVAS
jgi:preprotein translocase subunit Sec63